MRKIQDHFSCEESPVFHFGIPYADQMDRLGFPSMTVHQRLIYFYLYHRTKTHRSSVSEISRAVWGGIQNRSTARRALQRLQKLKLASYDHNSKGWFSLLPNGLMDVSTHGKIHPSEMDEYTHLDGQIHPPQRDKRRKEKQLDHALSSSPFLKQTNASIFESGWRKSLIDNRQLFKEPLIVPEDESEFCIWVATAASWRSDQPGVRSPRAYATRMAKIFYGDPEQSMEAIVDALRANRSDNPKIKQEAPEPEHEPILKNKNDAAIKPSKWLRTHRPELASRLDRMRNDTRPSAEHHQRRLKELERDFLRQHERTGHKNNLGADPLRNNMVIVFAKLASDYEAS